MQTRHGWRTAVAALCAGLLAAPWPAAAGARRADRADRGDPAARADRAERAEVSPRLAAALAGSPEPVRFLVRLRDQAAVAQAAAGARAVAAGQARPAARAAVAASLQETARRTQPRIAGLLARLRQEGHVRAYRPFWIVNGFAVIGDGAALAALAARPEVERIDPDAPVFLLSPGLPVETTPPPTPPGGGAGIAGVGWNIGRVGAPAAWDLGATGAGTVVASIDTGVDWRHPALATRFRGYNPADPGAPNLEGNWFDAVAGPGGTPYDDHGHGTHVTGIMVGRDDEGNHVGVAPGARWIAAKAFTATGAGQASWLLAAGQWMLAPLDSAGTPHPEWAPDVINNSWGGGWGLDEWFRPMVQAWRAAGIFPVFAVGNAGPGEATAAHPANYPEAFAAGATDRSDQVADFSSRGPSPYHTIKPDAAAPGVEIRSALRGGGYGPLSGTSMAAPHVSGAAALVLSANPDLTADEIAAVLARTAEPRTDSQYAGVPNNGYGYGLVQAGEAVAAVQGGPAAAAWPQWPAGVSE